MNLEKEMINASSGKSIKEILTVTALRIAKEYAEESKWINVDERLPQITNTRWSADVLCINKNGHQWVDSAFYDSDGNFLFWLSRTKEATHWQPLPPPPIATKEDS